MPIRPGTDLALTLAMCNVLIEKGFVDKPYLLNYTNSPFLVKEDGYFLKVDGKEQVWDTTSNSAKPVGTAGVTPALDGSYTVSGAKVKTSFQLLKEHVAQMTPEKAGEICGLSAEQDPARRHRVGPECLHRPEYHDRRRDIALPARRHDGLSRHRPARARLPGRTSQSILVMLLGAFHAVGGVRIGFGLAVAPNYTALDTATIKDPPYNINLTNSKYFPIGLSCGAFASNVMLNPSKYEVGLIPEVMLAFYGNYLLSLPPPGRCARGVQEAQVHHRH